MYCKYEAVLQEQNCPNARARCLLFSLSYITFLKGTLQTESVPVSLYIPSIKILEHNA